MALVGIDHPDNSFDEAIMNKLCSYKYATLEPTN